MLWTRNPFKLGMPLALAATAILGIIVLFTSGGAKLVSNASAATVQGLITSKGTPPWAERGLKGTRLLKGQTPMAVVNKTAGYVGQHAAKDVLRLNFGLPLRDKSVLNQLITLEGKTHASVTRAQLSARFTPPQAQINALERWLTRNGFKITHVAADHLSVGASAPTATVEKALHVRIADYTQSASTFGKIHQPKYAFYANANAARVPARLGVQTISGLSSVDRFYTSVQMSTGKIGAPDVRGGGYFPSDLQGLYDISGHGYNATGQTIGFTLWTANESQTAMTAYASATGDTPITVDPACIASGNSPTSPSSCSTQTVQPNHLLFIDENGNSPSDVQYNNVETGLDIEAAHGVATGVAEKYYASECTPTVPANSGITNSGACNGSDVGMEDAMEDAANDPTLHSVSDSWAYGGEAEWGTSDPFMIATSNILAYAAGVGTTFYFSTGDSGTYESGYPSDSPYVVAVGGTSTYSTSNPATYSTTTTWDTGGSWCSNIVARPAWQTGPNVASLASCPGRVIPDISTVADPNTGIVYYDTTGYNSGTGVYSVGHGQVGGTSLAAPVMNGLEADTENYIAAQNYAPNPTPSIGFVAPTLYQMGNSANYNSYFRDIQCGNTADPTSGPFGDAAGTGWDPATGWGEPDWFNFAKGYAITLGATNVAVPSSLSQNFPWKCAKTPSNSTERALNCPTSGTCYAVGSAGGSTPWYGTFLASGAWGAVNTFFKSTDGGQTWFPSNADMFSIACTSTSTCMEVGASGTERRTTDSGTTWTDTPTAPGNNKPLTQVTCPSSSICYAVGDRGNAMKSTDGGQTWSWLQSTDGNPIYGLSCPTTSVCYATDIYAHVYKTTDGGSTWTSQVTPITTPYEADVAETGGPNPWGGLMGISCSDANTCVGVGIYASVSGQTNPNTDPPIITTTDGGTTWTRQVSGAGISVGNSPTLSAPSLVGDTNIKVSSVSGMTGGAWQLVVDSGGAHPETVTVSSVGTAARTATTLALASSIGDTNIKVTSVSNMVAGEGISIDTAGNQETDTIQSVGTAGSGGTGVTLTSPLTKAHANGVAAQDIGTGVTFSPALSFAHASGATVQVRNLPNFLHSVSCLPGTQTCTAVGRAGAIVTTTNLTTWTPATSNTTNMLNSVTCLSTSFCMAVGQNGTVDVWNGTTWTATIGNGGPGMLASVTCLDTSNCYATGKQGITIATTNASAPPWPTWTIQAGGGTTQQMNGVSCPDANTCYAVGNVGTILKTANGGQTWLSQTSGTTQNLSGVKCTSDTACTAVGAAGTIVATSNGGGTWSAQTSGTPAALTGIDCSSSTACAIVGSVGGSTTLIVPASASATNIKVGSVTGFVNGEAMNIDATGANPEAVTISSVGTAARTATSLALAATAGTNNIKVTSVSNMVAGEGIAIDTGALQEYNVIQSVGTAGSGGTGVTLVSNLASSHANAVGVQDTGTGITFSPALSFAHAAGSTVLGGPIVLDTTNGSTWSTASGFGTLPLNAITCPSSTCYAAGSLGAIVKSSNTGQTWSVGTSGTTQSFNGVACIDNTHCVADSSTNGTFWTSDGSTWSQQGNPISGPTSALNATAIALNGAFCTSVRCMIGLGIQGDIMITSPLTVTVNTTSTYGTTPVTSGLSPSNAAITYSPSSEAGNVAGTLNCSTTATSSSNVGTYPISSCSGLADQGYTVIYDYTDSSHTVVKANQAIVIGTHAPSTAAYGSGFTVAATGGGSGNAVTYGSSGSCTNSGANFTMNSSTGTCTVTYDQAGNGNYNAAPEQSDSVTAEKADQTINVGTPAPASAVYGTGFTVAATGGGSGNWVTYSSSGGCTNSGADFTMTSGTTDCVVNYNQAGDGNYNAATQVTETVTAEKADQTITFATPANRTYGAPNFDPGATASSGDAASYGGSGACSIVSGKVHLTGAGTCTVAANQAGDANYNAAPQVQRSFSVAKAALSITANDRQKYYGQGLTLGTTAFTSSGLVGSDSVSGVTLTSSGASASAPSGSYGVVVGSAVAGPSTDLGNYTITYHNGTLQVSSVGIIGLNGVSVTGGGKIDSFDSSVGPYQSSPHGSAALVMSNAALSFADVSLFGSTISTQDSVSVARSASVSGNVTAGTTASISGSVGGTVTRHSPTTALTLANVPACSGYSSRSGISGGTFSYSPSTGNLTITSETVKLASGAYCFHTVTVEDGATLSVNGSVAIYLTGKLMGQGHFANSTNLPGNFQIASSFAGSDGVSILGGIHTAMTILAPRTDATISGGSFSGTLFAGTVSLTGGVIFHADQH